MSFLDQILERKRTEIDEAKAIRKLADLRGMVRDAPPVQSFAGSLTPGFGLIAEIKRKSPSGGEMRPENVDAAPAVYAKSTAVRAVSVLRNKIDFGMGIEEMSRLKAMTSKPILRKDFILEAYQVYEARAFGADAILLMANVLNRENLKSLFELASGMQMDVLFEVHTREEIESIPEGARIYGINSRKFKASTRWTLTKALVGLGRGGSSKTPDLSVDLETFSLIQHLPPDALKVAESGLKPAKLGEIIGLGYNAALVGTSLLTAPEGVDEMLQQFENAILEGGRQPAPPERS